MARLFLDPKLPS